MKGKGSFVKDLWGKTIRELILIRKKLFEDNFSSKMKLSAKGLKKTHVLKDLRRNIARVNTVLTCKIKGTNGYNR